MGVGVLAAIACVAVVGCSDPRGEEDPAERFPSGALDSARVPAEARPSTVKRVIDGDTVELRGLGSSRLIGVDTPEVHESEECFGPAASEFTEKMLAPRLGVRVLHGREPEDRYGRDLVYVWLPDGRLFNETLTRQGFARPLTIPPNDDLAGLFERAASAAAADERGLWDVCPESE
jgi:micrococcal nuclease